MPETYPVTGPRPAGAPPYEPVVRLGTPTVGGPGSHPNHPVLLPDPDSDDDVAPPPPSPSARAVPEPHRYRVLARPTAYVASAVAGAVLVKIIQPRFA